MTTPTPAPEPRYHLIIPALQLRHPLDTSRINGVNPSARTEIRGEFTEQEFNALCAGDIRRYMCREIESPEYYGSWTITVRAEDVFETNMSSLYRCISALLNRHYPDYTGDPHSLAKNWESVTPATLNFLLGVYDEQFIPHEEPDDNRFLELMREHGVGYDDLAYQPPA